jgi:choline dehydrogenase-like flavoprotein
MIDDVLIVGSGASAVHAAYPLVEARLSVSMLDFGNEDRIYGPLIPDASFLEARKTDWKQHRYFLGDRFEGIPFGSVRVGSQLTPPRQYITKDTQTLLPFESKTFSPMESLAMGGLASGWGAGSAAFSEADLKDFPVSLKDLAAHYEKVAERIGISGARDDLLPYYGDCKSMMPPLRNDKNALMLLDRYHRKRNKLNAAGFFMGQSRLAALTQSYRGRGPDRYLDMSFWGDADRSIWRPRYTLKELQALPNFSYHPSLLVQHFKEHDDGTVEVFSRNSETGREDSHRARKLILTAGVLGTTRIVLRSLNKYNVKVPFVCNPYLYVPMLNLGMLGQLPSEEKHSLGQLCVIYDPMEPGQAQIHAHVHSYRSLLNFKVIKEMPLPYREGIRIMKMLVSSLAILAIDHEDRPTADKYCVLHEGRLNSPDRLEIGYVLSKEVERRQRRYEKAVIRQFLRLGCIPLKTVRPAYGASLHYGGTFPMRREDKELTTDINGRLRGTRSVYLADSSCFPYLPAKGMTFTMMANANRIGENLVKEIK